MILAAILFPFRFEKGDGSLHFHRLCVRGKSAFQSRVWLGWINQGFCEDQAVLPQSKRLSKEHTGGRAQT